MLRLARAQDGNDYISIGISTILVTPGPSRPPAPPCGPVGGAGGRAVAMIHFLIVSGEGSSAAKTRDCGGSRALKTEMSIFPLLRNFNTF